ncbi:hypothetical protein ACX1NX_02840 [Acinetobacter sp. ANC 5383]
MAAETDVQFFSHLNAGCPQLTNNWGCMINLLDACLANGVSLPNVSSVTVATGGNITVNFGATHSVLLFQCVTLAGFTPTTLNGKYRVIGVPSMTQLTLSSDLSAQSAVAIGTAKLSPLGYEIIFSATTTRVYRALNPTAQHPYIRVDESLSSADGSTGIYSENYAKYAMVGLIENMSHIDDYLDARKLQLPIDTTDFSKNWKVTGVGDSCIRGWSKWYWAHNSDYSGITIDTYSPADGNRNFTLVGDKDAFYIVRNVTTNGNNKFTVGCGIYDSCLDSSVIPNWFLFSVLNNSVASTDYRLYSTVTGGMPFVYGESPSRVFAPTYNVASRITNNISCPLIIPNYQTGYIGSYNASNISSLQIPFSDTQGYLRGTLKHVYYNGKSHYGLSVTTPKLADNSMYVSDSMYTSGYGNYGSLNFYLGEIS